MKWVLLLACLFGSATANTAVQRLDEDSTQVQAISSLDKEKWGFGGINTYGAFNLVVASFERERRSLRRSSSLSFEDTLLGESTGLGKAEKEQRALSDAAGRAAAAGQHARCQESKAVESGPAARGTQQTAHPKCAENACRGGCWYLDEKKCTKESKATCDGYDVKWPESDGYGYKWCPDIAPTEGSGDQLFGSECGDCKVCLKIKDGKCKTGGGHDTKEECEGHDNHIWCGEAPAKKGQCEPWCANHAKPWDVKCAWGGENGGSCSACPECPTTSDTSDTEHLWLGGDTEDLGESLSVKSNEEPECPADCNVCFEYKHNKNKCHTGGSKDTEGQCTAHKEHKWCGAPLKEKSCREQCEADGIDPCSEACVERCDDWDFQCSCKSPSQEHCGLHGGTGSEEQCKAAWNDAEPTCPDTISSQGAFMTGGFNGTHDICAQWDSDLVLNGILTCHNQVFEHKDGICANDCKGCFDAETGTCDEDKSQEVCETVHPKCAENACRGGCWYLDEKECKKGISKATCDGYDVKWPESDGYGYKWCPDIAPTEGSWTWCGDSGKFAASRLDQRKEHRVCTKAEVKHLDMSSQSVGMLLIKRVSCYMNHGGGSTCASWKTGLCIDVGEDVFSDISNVEIGWRMIDDSRRFAKKAIKILRDAEESGAALGELPMANQCTDDRYTYKLKQGRMVSKRMKDGSMKDTRIRHIHDHDSDDSDDSDHEKDHGARTFKTQDAARAQECLMLL